MGSPRSIRNKRPRNETRRRAQIERLESRHVLAATPIQVFAAGLSGTEDMVLEVNGAEVQRWDNIGGDFNAGQFQTFNYTHPTTITADNVAVRMVDSGGAGRDLRVDGIRVDGVKFESESPTTWNTGAWDNDFKSIFPAYASSEVIYSSEGALHFSSDASSTISVLAAGNTGAEQMRLLIDDVVVRQWNNIGGDYGAGVFQTRTYVHPTQVRPEQIKVEFTNDSSASPAGDRNLRVDAVQINGRRYESESRYTFGTGTWVAGSIEPRYSSSEFLHGNGYFQYSSLERSGSRMIVWGAGRTGEESIQLAGLGSVAATFENLQGDYFGRESVPLGVVHPRVLELSDVEVAFINDGIAASGVSRDVRIDAIELEGVRHESEAATTFSTGTWVRGLGIQPGFKQSENLHGNVLLQLAQAPAGAGSSSLASAQYTVGEADGFVEVEFVRTASRGAVTIDYTTVDNDAIAGQDYTATSGVLVLRDGESSGTVRVPILNDSAAEGRHVFNVAADRVTGGAFLGQPRTATVTILDDDAPNAGDGIGLLGRYYAGAGFQTPLFERTDATINFNWGTGSPSPSVPSNDFSVRWTGQIEPLYSETYTFTTRTDDGARLWVNDVLIVDQWIVQSPTDHSGTITLQAGVRYDLRMEMYERAGGAVASLSWASPSQPVEIVPTSQLYSERVVSDTGEFAAQTLISGLSRPTAMDFSRVGGSDYLYISQQDGRVFLAIDGVLQSEVVVDYRTPVNNVRDRGLLGMVVHPDLPSNPYIYLLYTYDPPETQGQTGLAAPDNFGNRGSRLTRLTLDASNDYRTVVPGSDVVLLGKNSTWENLSSPDRDSTDNNSIRPSGLLPNGEWVPDILVTDSQSHTIGALDFGPDGSLFVTNGDGTSYGRVDPRTTRVQDLDSLSGKMLRIDPITGAGYTDNPFFTGDINDDRSKVYNYGLRNPFTLAVDQNTGVPYTGDVGWNSWEEINGGRGQNFGWPFFEGGAGNGSQGGDAINRRTGGYSGLAEAQAFYASNPDAAPPVWSRSHSAGGVAVVLGDFYEGDLYPEQYNDALFFTDFGDPTIRAITFDAAGDLDESFVVMGSVGSVVEMTMGLDGRMYYVDLSGNVGRIDYLASAPIASLRAPVPTATRGDYRPSGRGIVPGVAGTENEVEAATPSGVGVAFLNASSGGEGAADVVAAAPPIEANDAAFELLLIDAMSPESGDPRAAWSLEAGDDPEKAEIDETEGAFALAF